MELVLFIGLPGAGKSTFYQERFRDTHLRLCLDMLRTRHREAILLEACLRSKTPFVVDNTNPTREDRFRYIPQAKAAGFHITGYYFAEPFAACWERNQRRIGRQVIPEAGLRGVAARLTLPSLAEGFDELHAVRIKEGIFIVEPWKPTVLENEP